MLILAKTEKQCTPRESGKAGKPESAYEAEVSKIYVSFPAAQHSPNKPSSSRVRACPHGQEGLVSVLDKRRT
jgi:hypothetical protein